MSYKFTYNGKEYHASGSPYALWVTRVTSEDKYRTLSTIIDISDWPSDLVSAIHKYVGDDGFGGLNLQEYLYHLGFVNHKDV